MKLLTTTALTAALAALSGCAVYPPGSVGVSGTVYSDEPAYYRSAPPAYYEPGPYGPYYGPPPVYYRPAPVIINRGGWDHDRRGDRDRWERDHNRDGRGPQQGQRPPGAQPAPQNPQQQAPAPRPPRPDGEPPRNRIYANPDRPPFPQMQPPAPSPRGPGGRDGRDGTPRAND